MNQLQLDNVVNTGYVCFCPLASGSSGNCVYLATPSANILIDAGLSGIRIERALESIGVHSSMLDAIFITHEHSDHISGAGIMARRFGVNLYATQGTWESTDRAGTLGKLRKEQKHAINPGVDFTFRDITVRPFSISHDASNPVGYSFCHAAAKVTVATDLGHICPGVYGNIADSDILLIESNHDVEMLKNGSYPFHLKKRILGDKGHLSNVTCGQALTELADRLKHIYLGHLSEENNEPLLAFETVRGILEANSVPVNSPCGCGVSLYLADRYLVSKFLRIEVGG
ncbi:MAG: MBL fold metallo-hydrolase [Defluviitaleaceae bacterium]|nr:MBL fold metallo-hydrolase [Defluviitaleaceae bacterium]MCL2836795.1 MBL fold metallo-hydrolase [Defluviitaleaceae bacterium]